MQIAGHVIEYLYKLLMSDLFDETAAAHCCGKADGIILILGICALERVMRIMQVHLYWVCVVSAHQCCSQLLLGRVDVHVQSCALSPGVSHPSSP